MNRCGIVVDCSHVGDRTTLDVIKHARKPVAITHANPASVFPHARNKSDEVLKALKDNGGVIGCAAYRNITPAEACKTVDAWCEMVARTVDMVGIDHVGLGTDYSHNTDQGFYDWMRKGRWTRSVQYGAGSAAVPGKVSKPDWLLKAGQLNVVEGGLKRVGFNAEDSAKIRGGNWFRLYKDVFG